jgi:hypothetical protein
MLEQRWHNESKTSFVVAVHKAASHAVGCYHGSKCASDRAGCSGYLRILVELVMGGRQWWKWHNNDNHHSYRAATSKTLWDLLQLLLIPLVLAVAGFWFNHSERKAAELRTENEQKAMELRAKVDRKIKKSAIRLLIIWH